MGDVFIKNCQVLENRQLMEGTYLMRLRAPEIAAAAKPGQFVMVRTGSEPLEGGPLLRRPFSLHRLNSSGEISLLYRVIGVGTRIMGGVEPGRELEIMGPLGRGFDFSEAKEQSYLVAGGIGLAPMIALAEAMGDRKSKFFYGARTSKEVDVFLALIRQTPYEGELVLTSEDGLKAAKGMVTGPLAVALEEEPAQLFACGPRLMLARVAVLAREAGVRAQVSLEANMACGLGACLSCAVERASGEESGPVYSRVCFEGPVFFAEEVRW
ncbi:MAG: dihydroorotate dehydrogenase electron transfer subunit [Deltaproteobacteria bacterium]|nr:dihydroorotate dehydrogenase electron transfer subunit [Deltaproteobacteria bacterium]MBW2050661.1 dihydroorotate dehydrogenase electron transfer subunit [Deltaproteobacteria bacterium]MBW2139579.1 dihydroorotate dehydrogenase electron transfer subunit [Deltaproteobacteria bacterium]MBW2322935.1 dihydroorotate dehydrogenase electron transfer subunit [Deltaproteobacteria bacterium]